MIILFEKHTYKTSSIVNLIKDKYYTLTGSDKSVIDFVGYYFNSSLNKAVFILPKVFVTQDGVAFGICRPEDIIELHSEDVIKLIGTKHYNTIFELTIWLYQAIVFYRKRNQDTRIIRGDNLQIITSNFDSSTQSMLDIILSLIDFNKKNKYFITQVIKSNHSQQENIDWQRTTRTRTPIINNNTPIYWEVISRKKHINYDEELIIIFYSTLKHIAEHYGFKIPINENYTLITGKKLMRFQEKGTRKLKKIKYKYYSDKFLILWQLLYVYYEKLESANKSKREDEVLLAKNFNHIFEDMIDVLISDQTLPKYLKKQKDGKQLDHIFKHKSLLSLDNEIHYIGDSKYYKPSNEIKGQSIDKQYTYAKNVIQYNVDLFNTEELEDTILYRDSLTEGYNISPNFFITAYVNEELGFFDDGLKQEFGSSSIFHFQDRLFDRDSLILHTYNINFLFVLSSYINTNENNKKIFRSKVYTVFRNRIIAYLNENYSFYKLNTHENLIDFINVNFRLLNGKMFRENANSTDLILALEKTGSEEDIFKDIINLVSYEKFSINNN
ncbi:MAG: LlaJI family restriction endonuclease [Bacilli bacterium]